MEAILVYEQKEKDKEMLDQVLGEMLFIYFCYYFLFFSPISLVLEFQKFSLR